jgi:hypothetical protein
MFTAEGAEHMEVLDAEEWRGGGSRRRCRALGFALPRAAEKIFGQWKIIPSLFVLAPSQRFSAISAISAVKAFVFVFRLGLSVALCVSAVEFAYEFGGRA